MKIVPIFAMQEHPETNTELQKLEQCKNYLQSQGVFDNDSFFEIIGDEKL